MLAVIRSEAELRSLEAASFNPRMVRRIATGAKATLLTDDDGLHHRDMGALILAASIPSELKAALASGTIVTWQPISIA
jgi:hypothetical protein